MQYLLHEIKSVLKGLRARKGRSLLTVLGIVIGVAGVIVIVSLGAGAQQLVVGQVTKLGTNLISVLPGKSDESGPPASVFGVEVTTLSLRDVEALRDKGRAPFLSEVAGSVSGSATVVAGRESVDTRFTGTNANLVRIQNMPIAEGEFFSEEEDAASANVIVLGSAVADSLFPDSRAVGEVVKIQNVPFRVVGVAEEQGVVGFQNQDDQVYMPLQIAMRRILGISHLQAIVAKVDDASHVKAAIADTQRVLREEHRILDPENDDFSVRDLADAVKILSSITDGLRLFLGVMAGIALVVGGIGIMNIMLVTVSERTREIGLRKAVGATARNINRQFLIEAIILTTIGGIIGILAGSLVSFAISLAATALGYDWAFIVSLPAVLLALGISAGTGIVFGYYPAKKAASLDPIAALRHE